MIIILHAARYRHLEDQVKPSNIACLEVPAHHMLQSTSISELLSANTNGKGKQ
jgi:hypothetical protein